MGPKRDIRGGTEKDQPDVEEVFDPGHYERENCPDAEHKPEDVIPNEHLGCDLQEEAGAILKARDHLIISRHEVFTYDNALRQGHLTITGEIDDDLYRDFRRAMLWCCTYVKGPITVTMNSPGGDLFAGLAIYTWVRFCEAQYNKEVIMLGMGHAASGGSLIFQAGTKRIATPHFWCCIHQASDMGETWEKAFEKKDKTKLLDRLHEHMIEIYVEKSKLKPKDIRKGWDRKDWWLDSQELFQVGLCDRILKYGEKL